MILMRNSGIFRILSFLPFLLRLLFSSGFMAFEMHFSHIVAPPSVLSATIFSRGNDFLVPKFRYSIDYFSFIYQVISIDIPFRSSFNMMKRLVNVMRFAFHCAQCNEDILVDNHETNHKVQKSTCD